MTFANNQREERIVYLRRQEERNRHLPNYLRSLSNIAGRTISQDEVPSIDQSQIIFTNIRKRRSLNEASFSIWFAVSEKERMVQLLSSLTMALSGKRQYFLTNKFQDNFLLLIDTAFCLTQYEEVVELGCDTVYIHDASLNNRLMIDLEEDSVGEYSWIYEIQVQGKDWINLVYEAYKNLF